MAAASLLSPCRDPFAVTLSAVVGATTDDLSSVDSNATAAAVAETAPADVAGLCPVDSVTAAVGFYLPPTASVIVPFVAEYPSGVREKRQQLSTPFSLLPSIHRDRL